MLLKVTRVSYMDVDVPTSDEALKLLTDLSDDTVGKSMIFQDKTITYIRHVYTQTEEVPPEEVVR